MHSHWDNWSEFNRTVSQVFPESHIVLYHQHCRFVLLYQFFNLHTLPRFLSNERYPVFSAYAKTSLFRTRKIDSQIIILFYTTNKGDCDTLIQASTNRPVCTGLLTHHRVTQIKLSNKHYSTLHVCVLSFYFPAGIIVILPQCIGKCNRNLWFLSSSRF